MDFIDEVRKLAEEGFRYGIGIHVGNGKVMMCAEPATIAQVREFEHEMHITLPEDFVRYLTEIGNGGPGADWIYSLEKLRERNPYLAETADLPPMIGAGLPPEEWKAFAAEYEALENKVFKEENRHLIKQALNRMSEMEKRLIAGGLFIATPGCTMNWLLMCRGPAAGQIALIDFDYMSYYDHDPSVGTSFSYWMINGMNRNNEKAKNDVYIKIVTQHNERGIVPGVTNLTDILIELRIRQLREEGAKEEIDLVPALRDFYERNFANKSFRVWIAVHKNKVIGTCGLSIVEKPPYFSCTTGKIALLSSVYVEPKFRRRGIAKRLVETAVRYAEWQKCGAIHITASNDGVKLYNTLGFEHNNNFMQKKL